MTEHDQKQSEELTNLVAKTGDYVISGFIQGLAAVIGALFGLSPSMTTTVAKKIYDNKGLIIGIIVSPILIIALMLMISNQNARSKIDLGLEATSLEGINAVVLNVPYFNQWLEPDGTKAPVFPKRAAGWDLGQVICGAASVTMVSGYFGKLPYNTSDEHDLKRFAYSDQGMNLPSKCESKEIGGAFGMTAYDSDCQMSSYAGMSSYLTKMDLKATDIGKLTIDKVKSAIDNKHPLIVSMSAPVGHIAVIKGYTEDGRLVMNDPYRNVQDGGTSYSYNGKNALYQVDSGWTVNSVFEVSN